MSVRPLTLGVAGLGTVGAGVLKLLADNAALISARAGRPVAVVAVSARDRSRDRGVNTTGLRWYDDPVALAGDAGVDVVVECIGGSEGPAKALVEAALRAGKPVVTANKALREGLAANNLSRVAGILNGTCNYILTTMREQKREFADVLAEAQKLGYAEADPSFDIDGVDAAHKLAILAALAFGRPVDFASVHVEGIREVSALDFQMAEELGYRIKLLGIAQRTEAGISTRVHPCMVPQAAPIARVDGVFNAVVAEGDFVGRVVLQGRGAGAGPTASAVVADVIDIARGRFTPVWGSDAGALAVVPSVPMAAHTGCYYLRLMVVDRPGVIADVTGVLRDHSISLESMLQRGRAPGEAVPVVLTTHECDEAAMRAAIARIEALAAVMEKPVLIRIEPA
jgi:homoserine dehydrogenase